MNFFLITTSNKYKISELNFRYLILGKWCLNYKDKRYHNKTILNYHWNDRNKLYKDFVKINQLYEKVLDDLANFLNDFHNLNYSKKYWRIVIGLWLNYFIEIIFDRFEMLNVASNYSDNISINHYKYEESSYIPKNMTQFMRFVETDNWNEYIYFKIIKKRFSKKIKFILTQEKKNNFKEDIKKQKISFKRKIYKIVLKYLPYINSNKFYLKNTYLSKYNLFKILFKIKSFNFDTFLNYNLENKVNFSTRNLFFKKYSNNNDDFYNLIIELVSENIPLIYLEDFKNLHDLVNEKNKKYVYKSVFTSNAYAHDDLFKIKTAYNVERGAKLIIGQHGGNDGTCKFSSIENHQIKISDIFLSWGWKKKDILNILPLGNFICNGKKISYNKNGHGLVVSTQVPKYSYRLFSFPIASQWLDYFNDQCVFYENLTEKIQKKLIFKINNLDYGWNERERLIDKFDKIKINQYSSVDKLLNKSRIHIATYNGTVFLETLYYNIPTLIFWNRSLWELNEQSIKDFNILKKIGIFYDDPVKAANKLISIWDNIDDWWYSKEIQDVKNEFCRKYNYQNNNLINDLANILNNKNE